MIDTLFESEPIHIIAEPAYLEDESEPQSDQFVWAYQITIKNQSDQTVKLRRRHWKITDSRGSIHEIEGKGVVGLEPELRPGESFSYTSGAVLSAPSGIMVGSYEMERMDEGKKFKVPVPAFSLDSPHEKICLN